MSNAVLSFQRSRFPKSAPEDLPPMVAVRAYSTRGFGPPPFASRLDGDRHDGKAGEDRFNAIDIFLQN